MGASAEVKFKLGTLGCHVMLTITVPEHLNEVAIDFESKETVRRVMINRDGQIIGESNRPIETVSLSSLTRHDISVNVTS